MLNEKEVQKFLEETGRTGGIIPGLDAMEALMKELGDVQDRLNTIQVGSPCFLLCCRKPDTGRACIHLRRCSTEESSIR